MGIATKEPGKQREDFKGCPRGFELTSGKVVWFDTLYSDDCNLTFKGVNFVGEHKEIFEYKALEINRFILGCDSAIVASKR